MGQIKNIKLHIVTDIKLKMDPQGATKSAKDLAKEEKKEEKKRKEEEKKAEKKRKEEEKKNQKAEKKERKSSVKKRPSGCNSITTHTKALSKVYEGFGIDKFEVPPEKEGWAVPFPEYAPTDFTTKLILETKPVWADPDITDKEAFDKINFNVLDGPTNRCSFVKDYTFVDGVPQILLVALEMGSQSRCRSHCNHAGSEMQTEKR